MGAAQTTRCSGKIQFVPYLRRDPESLECPFGDRTRPWPTLVKGAPPLLTALLACTVARAHTSTDYGERGHYAAKLKGSGSRREALVTQSSMANDRTRGIGAEANTLVWSGLHVLGKVWVGVPSQLINTI